MKIKTIMLLCLTLLHIIAFANTSTDIAAVLSEADQYRTADAKRSQLLLGSIDVATLTQQQSQLYYYLVAYNLSMAGQLEQAIAKLEKLLTEPLSDSLRQRSLSSLIIWYAGTRNWYKGMQTVDLLQTLFLDRLTGDDLDSANVSLVVFYNQLEQYQQASNIAQQVMQSSHSQTMLCKITSEWLNSNLHLHPEQMTSDDFDKGMALCEATNALIQMHIVASYKAEYWVKTKHFTAAQTLLENRLAKVEEANYPPLTAGYYDLLVQVYEQLGQLDKAENYALLNIANEQQHQYKTAILNANRVLAKIAQQKGDYQAAFTYTNNVLSEENSKFDQEFTKLLAIQNAKLDNLQKTNHIALLDKENTLLKTQSALINKQSQNERLVLALVTLIMAVLIFWILRSRRFHKQLRKMAETDELTGVSNRHHFNEMAQNSLKYCQKEKRPLSLIIFDLDHFKNINDKFGHQVGDWALKAAVKAAKFQCRQNDVVARLGGEEFVILLPSCDAEKALKLAESCRAAIAAVSPKEIGKSFQITASFGVADSNSYGYEFDTLFSAADDALYQSKYAGRNKVYCSKLEQPVA